MGHRKTLGLVGAGQIGGTLAHLAALRGLCDVSLYDRAPGLAKGKALDISHSLAINGSAATVSGSDNFQDLSKAGVLVVTAGFPRQPGMSRKDLLQKNVDVFKDVAAQIKQYASQAIVIVVTNPLDVMTGVMQHLTNFPHNRVFGMAGILDSGRFVYLLSQKLKVSMQDIKTMVLGGHGDLMVPLISATSVSGVPLKVFMDAGHLSQGDLETIIQKTRSGGAEIVQLLQKGSAYVAPAESCFQMVKAIFRDEKRLLPCSAYNEGQYDAAGIYAGVPVVLGADGVESIVKIQLDADEETAFQASAADVKDDLQAAKTLL